MPNVLDLEPLRAFAKRASDKIHDPRIKSRFERLAIDQLLRDARNFRPATALELERAPDWARAALARGESVDVFKLYRGASQRLHNLARRLADTCRLANIDCADRPHNIAVVRDAREFLEKIDRASFEATRRKAYRFARLLEDWTDTQDEEQVCTHQVIATVQGRTWIRVTSVSELRAVGREFQNCLARTTRTSAYGGGLREGAKQFWVLRDARGAGLIVVMAQAPLATALQEVRGPRNARIASSNPDLQALSRALGIRPPQPPPPPPARPPDVSLAVLLARLPCKCQLCAPSSGLLALRVAASLP